MWQASLTQDCGSCRASSQPRRREPHSGLTAQRGAQTGRDGRVGARKSSRASTSTGRGSRRPTCRCRTRQARVVIGVDDSRPAAGAPVLGTPTRPGSDDAPRWCRGRLLAILKVSSAWTARTRPSPRRTTFHNVSSREIPSTSTSTSTSTSSSTTSTIQPVSALDPRAALADVVGARHVEDDDVAVEVELGGGGRHHVGVRVGEDDRRSEDVSAIALPCAAGGSATMTV